MLLSSTVVAAYRGTAHLRVTVSWWEAHCPACHVSPRGRVDVDGRRPRRDGRGAVHSWTLDEFRGPHPREFKHCSFVSKMTVQEHGQVGLEPCRALRQVFEGQELVGSLVFLRGGTNF